MEIAALIVAIASLVLAGLSWWQSRRSADAAEASARETAEMVEIEKARHRQENKPIFDVTGTADANDDLATFWLTVTGPETSYLTEVEAIEKSAVEFLRNDIRGSTSNQILSLGEVKQGVPVSFFGHVRTKGRGSPQRFRFAFTDGTEAWTDYRELDIQWTPRAEYI